MRTIPPGFLLTYVGEYEYYWTDMMAASTAVAIPIVLLFMVPAKILHRRINRRRGENPENIMTERGKANYYLIF